MNDNRSASKVGRRRLRVLWASPFPPNKSRSNYRLRVDEEFSVPLEEHVGPKELTADRQDRRIVPCDCFVWVGDAGASWPGGAHPLQATRNYRTAEGVQCNGSRNFEA